MKNEVHELKLREIYCDDVYDGTKNFEVRKNDRGYQKGDHISFIPLDKDGETFFHPVSEKEYIITYVHSGLGLENDYVVLGIKEATQLYVDVPIEAVGFSDRCWKMLKRNGIDTTGQLEAYSREGLMKLRNIGKKTATVIIREFEEYKRKKG